MIDRAWHVSSWWSRRVVPFVCGWRSYRSEMRTVTPSNSATEVAAAASPARPASVMRKRLVRNGVFELDDGWFENVRRGVRQVWRTPSAVMSCEQQLWLNPGQRGTNLAGDTQGVDRKGAQSPPDLDIVEHLERLILWLFIRCHADGKYYECAGTVTAELSEKTEVVVGCKPEVVGDHLQRFAFGKQTVKERSDHLVGVQVCRHRHCDRDEWDTEPSRPLHVHQGHSASRLVDRRDNPAGPSTPVDRSSGSFSNHDLQVEGAKGPYDSLECLGGRA